jgi:starch-binding outer membrane protein, SusD/RagB family
MTHIQNRSPEREDIMKRKQRDHSPRVRRGSIGALLGVLLLAVSFAACDGLDRLLTVQNPGEVDAEDLRDPENAHFLVSGTIADFECALGAYIVNQGMLGNELRDATTTAARFSLDRRDHTDRDPYGVNSCEGNPPGIYRPLATARWTADNALAHLDQWTDAQVPNRTRLIGQAAAYGGYTHVLMGEGFCTTVIQENGAEVQPDSVFRAAIRRFDRAVEAAGAAGDTQTRNLALLGRARAHLNLGNNTAAAADARAVLNNDPEFNHVATASGAASRRYNRVGEDFWQGRITVDPLYRNLEVGGVPDPRVGIIDTETTGFGTADPIFLAAKIGTARTASLREPSIPVGTWREAHLIIAEVEGGQEAVNRINLLRDRYDLPHFASTDPAVILAQVIEERSRELFLEGHHLGDLRRHNLPFLPEVGEPYIRGGTYGLQTCFLLPEVERNNNPNVPTN